jgi:ATP-dependent Clp protease ATP-binding subunit ClpA
LLLQVRKIASIMLAETKQRVATKGIELAVGPRLLERMIQDGYSLEYGVRPLRQVGTAGGERVSVCRTGRAACIWCVL